MPEQTNTSLGPIGRNVVRNTESLRRVRGLSLITLSARLASVGRSIGDTVLHRQSKGLRRVDSDDLIGLALALGVSPVSLLFPRDAGWDDEIQLTETVSHRAYDVWRWGQGLAPLPAEMSPPGAADVPVPPDAAADFAKNALPRGGELAADPAMRDAQNVTARLELALRDFAVPETWDMRRSALIRAYRVLGAAIEDMISRGDLKATRAGAFKFDGESARRTLIEAARQVHETRVPPWTPPGTAPARDPLDPFTPRGDE